MLMAMGEPCYFQPNMLQEIEHIVASTQRLCPTIERYGGRTSVFGWVVICACPTFKIFGETSIRITKIFSCFMDFFWGGEVLLNLFFGLGG